MTSVAIADFNDDGLPDFVVGFEGVGSDPNINPDPASKV